MLSVEWLTTVAPVGRLQQDTLWAAFGAGVFFNKPPLLWLVTANHVVNKVGREQASVLITQASSEGMAVVEVGKILANSGLSWVEDPASDLAAIPMPLSPNFAINAVTPEYCLRLKELIPSMPCYTIGCPYGLYSIDPKRATPLVLDGIISGVDSANQRIYTSAPTFPGNSGGPLIAIRSPFRPGGGMVVGRSTVLLTGIMLQSAMLSARDVEDKTSPLEVEHETPPLRLGVAAPMDAVFDLLNSKQAQAITAQISSRAG